jgi:predicted nucleic acid-binding protein
MAVASHSIRLLVPCTFAYEVANALWAAVGRGRISRSAAEAGIDGLLGFGFESCLPDPQACLDIALRHRIAVYDACYLQIALASGSELWTIDAALRSAAGSAGVRVEP